MSNGNFPEVPKASSIIESGNHPSLEQIEIASPRGLVQINQFAGEFFSSYDNETHDFEWLRTIMGNSEKDRARVLKAVKHHDFPSPTEVDTETYNLLLKATQLKEEIARGLILHFVENNGATFGLKDYEIDVLTTTCRLGSAYDELCLKWRDDVANNPLNTRAKELNLTNQYSVIRSIDGADPKEVSYAEAYPEQVSRIVETWRSLAGRLFNDPNEEAQGLSEYFDAYADALSGKRLTQLSDLWKVVDTVWMRGVKGRLQPLGSREYGYYDPNKIRVIPDFRLILGREEVGIGIAATKDAEQRFLAAELGQYQSFRETESGLKKVQIILGDDIVFAGTLDFQPSGQSLPNEDDVKDAEGTKTFLNQDVTNVRWEMALELAKKAFPEDFALFDQVDPVTDGTEIDTAGHEFAEPLFKTQQIEDGLGLDIVSLLNEDLANLCATFTLYKRVEAGELPEEALIKHVVRNLGVYLRYLDSARGKEHLRSYYEGIGLQGFRRMIKAGFIYKEGSNWRIDQSKLETLYSLSRVDLHNQAIIAETKDKELARQYLSGAKETHDVMDLLARVKS